MILLQLIIQLHRHCDFPVIKVETFSAASDLERRSNIGSRSRNGQRLAIRRANQTPDQRAEANELIRVHVSRIRTGRTQEEREPHAAAERLRQQRNRDLLRQVESNANRRVRKVAVNVQLHRADFQYDCTIHYSEQPCVTIGPINVICQYCNALKFHSETPRLCCAGGKVKLPPFR